jgi:uncharacterized protein YcgL (UPF0745 family)
MSGVLVQVYRSPRRADTYLLTEKAKGLTAVPEALFGTFGNPEPAFVFHLTPGRALAHADPALVLEALKEKGFYLQLPPPKAEA